MSTKQKTVDYLLEQMESAGSVKAPKMFGEYAIYCQEKVVALVCDDQLFVKPSSASMNFSGHFTEAPPYPSAKNYLKVAEEKWEDKEWLSNFIKQTANALPAPKPKKILMKGIL